MRCQRQAWMTLTVQRSTDCVTTHIAGNCPCLSRWQPPCKPASSCCLPARPALGTLLDIPSRQAVSMITLFHCVSARSFRPLWTLEEIGMPYALKLLPFPPRALRRDYLQDNPLGTVPLLLDGASRMTESAAICQFLATRHAPATLAVDSADPDYADWLNWLHFGEATLTFPQTLVLRYGRFETAERQQPQVVTDYTRWFLARLRAIDSALHGRDYLCG